MSIPKIIHQTYYNKELPLEIQKVVNDLRQRNPDWEYRFYTDDNILEYIKTNFDEHILSAYQKINPDYGAAKADLFRYLVLYKEGGVYLDIKSSCIYPLSQIILSDDKLIVSQWQNDRGQKDVGTGLYRLLVEDMGIIHGEYQQWFLICEKNSPVMKYVIKQIVSNIHNYRPWHYGFHCYGKRGVLFVTGPVAYTRAVHSVQSEFPIRFVRYDKDLGFVYNAIAGEQSHTKILKRHYSQFRGPIVNQGRLLNLVFNLYIVPIRLTKAFLKTIGYWKE